MKNNDHERRLEDGDGERRDRVERSEIDEGDPHRQRRAQHEDAEDRVVDALRNDVFAHSNSAATLSTTEDTEDTGVECHP